MKRILCMTSLALALAGAMDASAEARRPAGGEAGQAQAAVQNLLRQTTAERDALAQEKQQLQKDLDAARKEAEAGKQKASASEEALGKYQAANGQLSGYIEQQNGKLQEMAGKFQELINTLKQSEAQRASLEQQLGESRQQLEVARADNAKLVGIGQELMEHYEKKGVWDSMLQREPVTQLKRVEIENLMEKYRAELRRAAIERPPG